MKKTQHQKREPQRLFTWRLAPADGTLYSEYANYSPFTWVDERGIHYIHSYQIGGLVLCLWDETRMKLFEASTRRWLAFEDTYTTNIEQVIRGVESLATLIDWSTVYERSKQQDDEGLKAIFLEIDRIYAHCFGIEMEVSLFGRRFQRALAQELDEIQAAW